MRRLVRELEEVFAGIVRRTFPRTWDEDHITYLLLEEMPKVFEKRVVQYHNFSKIITWTSYKNRRSVESQVGDISILVNIQFTSGEILRGVGFVEAKRMFTSGSFESMSPSQLDTIHSNAPYSYLLLYLPSDENIALKFPDQSTWRSHFWSSPINTSAQLIDQVSVSDNAKALRVSLPFSMLLTARYFWGLDLDYREKAYELALTGAGELGPPPFLAIINIYYDGQSPIQIALPDIWDPIL